MNNFREQQLQSYLSQPLEETTLPDDINIKVGIYNESGIETDFLVKKIKETIYQHYPLSTIEIEQQ
jgi:hypothetical protein